MAVLQKGITFVATTPEVKRDGCLAAYMPDLDPRALDARLQGGRRYRSRGESLPQYVFSKPPDWERLFDGPDLCTEYLGSIQQSGSFVAYSADWIRSSGVAEGSAAAHEHRGLVETLPLLVEAVRLHAPNIMYAEQLCRRLSQIEIAVERNPLRPDYSGSAEAMGGATESGAAATRQWRSWLGSKQKERAGVLKQFRIELEEREQLEKNKRKQPKAGAKAKAE